MRKNKFLAALAIAACLATSVPLSASAATPGQATDPTKVAYGTVTKTEEAVLADMYDDDFYKEQNPDLAAAGIVTKEARFAHFIQRGVFEGRACNKDFNVSAYMAYEDLQKAFGANVVAYYVHYNAFGKNEKRFTTVEGAVAAGKTVKSIDGKVVTAAAPKAAATSGSTTSKSDSKSDNREATGKDGGKLEKNKGEAKIVEAVKIAALDGAPELTVLEKNLVEAKFATGFGLTTSGVVVNFNKTGKDVKEGPAYGYWATGHGNRQVGTVLTVSNGSKIANHTYVEDDFEYGGVATPGDRLALKGFYDTTAKLTGKKNNKIVGFRDDYWYKDDEGTYHLKAINDEQYHKKGTGAWNIVQDDYGKDKYVCVDSDKKIFAKANYNDDHLVIKKDVRVRESKDGLYATILDENGSSFRDGKNNLYVYVDGSTADVGVEGLKDNGRGWSTVSVDDENHWVKYKGHAHELVDWTEAVAVDKDYFTHEFGNMWTWKKDSGSIVATHSTKEAESGDYYYYDKNVIYVSADNVYLIEEDSDVYLKTKARLVGSDKLTYKFVGHVSGDVYYYYDSELKAGDGLEFAYLTDAAVRTVDYWQNATPTGKYTAEKIDDYTYYFKNADYDEAFDDRFVASDQTIKQYRITGRFYIVDKDK